MILNRANSKRQIPVIRATLVSAHPSECLEIRLWSRPFVSRVLCVQGSLCPWFYVARDEQIDPLCRRTYEAKALCVQGSMWPQSTCYCSLFESCKLQQDQNSVMLDLLSQPNFNHNLTSTSTTTQPNST